MISPTYGDVTIEEVANIIKNNVINNRDSNYHITIGTDSQNSTYTKIVTVIAVHNVGHGGFFFYYVNKVQEPIKNIRVKLTYETQLSLECANELLEILEKISDNDFDYTELDYAIHVDAGHNGKSKQLINDLVTWVTSSGFPCEIKPCSFAASSIANKYSK